MELRLEDRWDDVWGNRYMTIEIVSKGRVDVKESNDESKGFVYVMDCQNGMNVYKKNALFGFRNLIKEEYDEIIEFAKEQLRVEEEMDRRLYG